MSWKREFFTGGCSLLLALSPGCMTNQLFAYSEEIAMQEICEIPEDLSAFEAWLYSRFGGEISASDAEDLKREMEFLGESETIDVAYSMTEKVRLIKFKKACIAPDKVPYDFYLGVIVDLEGKAIVSQSYLIYTKADMLNGKRDFRFGRIFGSRKDFTELLSKKTVGLMNRVQLEEYMISLGCSRLKDYKGNASIAFKYYIEPEKHLASRMAAYDFSVMIQVYLDSEGIVEKLYASF